MKSSNIFIGILVALGAGALAGIIINNAKDGIRKDLQNKSKDYLDKLRKKYEIFLDKIAIHKYDAPLNVEPEVVRVNPE